MVIKVIFMEVKYDMALIDSSGNEPAYIAPSGSLLYLKVFFSSENSGGQVSGIYLLEYGQSKDCDWLDFNRHSMSFPLGRYVMDSELSILENNIQTFLPKIQAGYKSVGIDEPAQFDITALNAINELVGSITGLKLKYSDPYDPFEVFSRTFAEMSESDLDIFRKYTDLNLRDLAIRTSVATTPCMHPYDAFVFIKETWEMARKMEY